MGKHYCDYCDVFLTHDSPKVRRDHNSGRNHIANVKDYYANIDQVQAQEIIDTVAKDYDAHHIPRPASIAGNTDVRLMGLNGPRAARGLTQVPITGQPIRLGIGESGIEFGAPPGQPEPPMDSPAASNPQRAWNSGSPAPGPPTVPPTFNRPPPVFNPALPPPGFNPSMPPPGFNPAVPPPGFNPSRPPPGFNPAVPPPPFNARLPPNFNGPPPGFVPAQR